MGEDSVCQGWQLTGTAPQLFFCSKEMFLTGVLCNTQMGT